MEKPKLIDRILSRGGDPGAFQRRWNCPDDEMITAYVDSALDGARREGLQRHLADCAYCRNLVADTVKLQRETRLPEVPAALIRRVRSCVPATSRRWGWSWMPVATAGTLACAALAVTFLRTPQSLTIPTLPAPAGPAISKSGPSGLNAGPALGPGAAIRETVRQPRSLEYLPNITEPRSDSVLARGRLEFRWTDVPDAVYYQVRVVTTEGDLVWQGDSGITRAELPDRLGMSSGKYFVLVTAVMENGRTRKSNPVGFQIAGPR
jgi:hypothetical protein